MLHNYKNNEYTLSCIEAQSDFQRRLDEFKVATTEIAYGSIGHRTNIPELVLRS